jgi:hypothetical protein
MDPEKPQAAPAEKPADGPGPRLLSAGVAPLPVETLSLVRVPPQPVLESDEALQQAFNTVEAIKEGEGSHFSWIFPCTLGLDVGYSHGPPCSLFTETSTKTSHIHMHKYLDGA